MFFHFLLIEMLGTFPGSLSVIWNVGQIPDYFLENGIADGRFLPVHRVGAKVFLTN
jgi:hypothetical protein